jgi:hypothetical protein
MFGFIKKIGRKALGPLAGTILGPIGSGFIGIITSKKSRNAIVSEFFDDLKHEIYETIKRELREEFQDIIKDMK